MIELRLAVDRDRPVSIDCRIENCPFCGPKYEGKGVWRIRPRVTYFNEYENGTVSDPSVPRWSKAPLAKDSVVPAVYGS